MTHPLFTSIKYQEKLASAGYTFHRGEADDRPDLGIDAHWFCWSDGKCDVECGPTENCFDNALLSALDHFLDNAEIPTHDSTELATEKTVIRSLIAVARAAFQALDDSEDGMSNYTIKVQREDAAALNAALDKLDELPDDRPGYTMGPAGKAEWALRNLITPES